MIYDKAAVALLALAAVGCTTTSERTWYSGFERGFPGTEWFSDSTSYSPSGELPPGRAAAWSIVHRGSGEPVFAGDHAYKAWIVRPAQQNHRAYPGIHAEDPANIPRRIPAPLVNSFMVWLDCDWSEMAREHWIHLATWANNPEWHVHTMAVRDRMLEFAHVEPFHGEYIGPLPRGEFPLRRWVRMTAYIEYNGAAGFVQVWQDGVAMLRARITRPPGRALLRAHWGLYAHPAVRRAVMYNDEIRIWTLERRLEDLVTEPLPPS